MTKKVEVPVSREAYAQYEKEAKASGKTVNEFLEEAIQAYLKR